MTQNKQRAGMAVIVAAALAALAVTTGAWLESPGERQPVRRPKAADPDRHALVLNGNRNADEIVFDHDGHQKRLDEAGGCANCHHLHKPNDINTSCRFCHADMVLAVSIFNHDLHGDKLGGNDSCVRCHDLDKVKSGDNAAACSGCHAEDMRMPPAPKGQRFNFMARGYSDAMHGLCLSCHRKQAEETGRLELSRCDTCHQKAHHEENELTPR